MQKDYYGYSNNKDFSYLFDNREVLGYRGKDKMHVIVRL
jgi:hypothetical protein